MRVARRYIRNTHNTDVVFRRLFCNKPTSTSTIITKTDNLIYSIDDNNFATITLNKPQIHNAFSDIVINELSTLLDKIKENESLFGLFLSANGKSFSAGADLNWMKKASTYTRDENIKDAMALSTMLYKLNTLPIPTIALIQGAAFGGGVGLISSCDITIGLTSCFFIFSEVKLGLIPATIAPYVIKRIGSNNCRRYFLTGEKINSQKAYEIGLLNEIVENNEQLNDYKYKLCQTISLNSKLAMKKSKELIQVVDGKDINQELMIETAKRLADQRETNDFKKRIKDFLEKK